jgi:hypothetical protein
MPIGSHGCLRHELTRPHEYPTILHQLLCDNLTPSQDDAIARWL